MNRNLIIIATVCVFFPCVVATVYAATVDKYLSWPGLGKEVQAVEGLRGIASLYGTNLYATDCTGVPVGSTSTARCRVSGGPNDGTILEFRGTYNNSTRKMTGAIVRAS